MTLQVVVVTCSGSSAADASIPVEPCETQEAPAEGRVCALLAFLRLYYRGLSNQNKVVLGECCTVIM